MPIIPDESIDAGVDRVINYAAAPGIDPSFKEKLTSAFRLENTVISTFARNKKLPDGYADTEYDVFSKLTDQEKENEQFVKLSALADNDEELEAVRNQYNREQEDRSKLTGIDGIAAGILAGTFDPVNLIPVGGAATKAYKTGNVLKGGLAVGAVTAGSVGISEILLQQSQLSRTGAESAMNVTGGMLLGGILGGAMAKFSPNAKAAKEVEDSFDGPLVNTVVKEQAGPMGTDSVGAAAVFGDVRVKGKYVEKALKALSPIDPLAKVMTASSKAARKYGAMLFENPLMTEGYQGRSVEQISKTKQGAYFGRALNSHLSVFTEAKKAGFKGKRGEFNQLVSREMANPGSTGNQYAKKSAEAWRKEVYGPVLKDLQELKLIGDDLDVKTAQQYLNRRWNKEAVAGKLSEFKQVVSKWLKETQPDIEDADELARDIGLRIMGTPDGMIRYDTDLRVSGGGGSGMRSPFKARSFLIPDELVDQFLDRDIEELAHLYLKHTVPDMELFRAFGSPKTPVEDVLDFRYIKKEVMEDYAKMAAEAKTEKESSKMLKDGEAVVKALAGMRDRMRGVYDMPDGAPSLGRRINSAFRNLNYVRLMGGVLASSIPDIGKQVMAEGFMRAFGDGFVPLIKNLKGFKVRPEIKNEIRYYGLALDSITSGRVEALADINSYALGNSKIERGLEYVSGKFGNIALINQWNDAMKTAHALAMQARVYDDLAKGKFDERLAKLGLSEDEAKGIFEQAKKYGRVDNGARLFNPSAWDRQDLAFAWSAALRKESDRVVIVPGQEKPLFMSRDIGKTLLQFRSFMLSSTQRTLLASAQGQEANLLGGMLSMITLGSMVYAFKQWDSGREISDDPRVWIAEGIDRSGALGIIMEASNTAEKISGNRFGLRSLMGIAEPASRFASRSEYEAMMGPTYGSALPGILRLAQAGASEHEWKESDTRSLRRMLPFQNLMFLRRGIDAAEKYVHEGLIE